MYEWTVTEDRQPQPPARAGTHDSYLCTLPDGKVSILRLLRGRGREYDKVTWSDDRGIRCATPIAWMPLPDGYGAAGQRPTKQEGGNDHVDVTPVETGRSHALRRPVQLPDRNNSEGYCDPTAYQALLNIVMLPDEAFEAYLEEGIYRDEQKTACECANTRQANRV